MKIGIAIGALAVAMAAGAVRAETPAATPERPVPHIMFAYMVEAHQMNADDDREVITQASMRGEASLSFSFYEIVKGATTPVVRETRHWQGEDAEPTSAQQDALIKALTDAGVFTLQSTKTETRGEYYAHLDIRIGSREASFTFSTPPEGAQLAVHKVLLDFVHQFGLDAPKPGEEKVSEGDLVPAQTVAFADLLAHPEAYNGKRVRLTGYYHGQFEGETFCIDKKAVRKNRYDKCIWRGESSTFANPAEVDAGNDSWQVVEGVFFKGPGGHLGLWPGEIERLTRVEVAAAPGRE